jgi:hypothetical protein
MSKIRATWCSAAVALLVALSAFADASTPAPAPKAANGIILTGKQARACSGDREKYVTPPASEVQRLESSLSRALTDTAANHKSGCTEIIEHMPRTCPPIVDDGGSCVWYIRFDVKRGTFDHFATNGEA